MSVELGAVVSEYVPVVAVRIRTPELISMVLPTSAEANEPVPSSRTSPKLYSNTVSLAVPITKV